MTSKDSFSSKPILERLKRPHDRNKCMARYYQPCTCDTGNWDELVDAAADEIERLQREKEQWFNWRHEDANTITHLRSEIGRIQRELASAYEHIKTREAMHTAVADLHDRLRAALEQSRTLLRRVLEPYQAWRVEDIPSTERTVLDAFQTIKLALGPAHETSPSQYNYVSMGWCSAHGHWRHEEGHNSCPTCHAEKTSDGV